MLESLMLILLGFLVASLLALIGLRLVWRRAVSVTRDRAEAISASAPSEPAASKPAEPQAETSPAKSVAPETSPATTGTSAEADQSPSPSLAPDTARLDALERRIASLEERLAAQDRQMEEQKRDLRTVRMERDAAIEEAQRLHRTADAETQKRKANELLFKRLETQAREILNQIADITGDSADSSLSQQPSSPTPAPHAPAPHSRPDARPALGPDLPPEPNNDRTAANGAKASMPLAETSDSADDTVHRRRIRAEELTLSERIKALQKGVAE